MGPSCGTSSKRCRALTWSSVSSAGDSPGWRNTHEGRTRIYNTQQIKNLSNTGWKVHAGDVCEQVRHCLACMWAKEAVVNNGRQRQRIKEVRQHLPDARTAILAHALLVKAIHLIGSRRHMPREGGGQPGAAHSTSSFDLLLLRAMPASVAWY